MNVNCDKCRTGDCPDPQHDLGIQTIAMPGSIAGIPVVVCAGLILWVSWWVGL